MNKVRVGGLHARCPHFECDLPAMICRVHEHVRKDIFQAARPRLAFGVAVFDFLVESAGRKWRQVVSPEVGHFIRKRLAFLKTCGGPYGQTLALVPQAFEPQLLRGEDVRHPAYDTGGHATGSLHGGQALAIRPGVVGEHAEEVLSCVHDSAFSFCAAAECVATDCAQTVR